MYVRQAVLKAAIELTGLLAEALASGARGFAKTLLPLVVGKFGDKDAKVGWHKREDLLVVCWFP